MRTKDIIKKETMRLGRFVIHDRENTELVRGRNEAEFFIALYNKVENDLNPSHNYKFVREFLLEFFKINHFEFVQLECDDVEMTRFFLDQFFPYMISDVSTLVLSKENIKFFKKEQHPCVLLEREKSVISNEDWLLKKDKFKKSEGQILNRLIAVAQSDNFTLIERKVHLYLLGMQISRSQRFIPDFFVLDYNKIASVFQKSFDVKKAVIFKTIDRLLRKMAITVDKQGNHLIFNVTDSGPMDLISNDKKIAGWVRDGL